MAEPEKRMHADFTISTKVPVIKQRVDTIAEYLSIIARSIGLFLSKTTTREVKDG
jgi:hypothetical protein